MWLRGRSCVRKQILINLKQIWTASLIACKCSAFDVVNDAKRRRTCVRQATSRRDDILLTVGRDLRQHLDGTNQTLKVGHANQSGVTLSGASKVLTNQICDANGKNCKNVSQLSTGTATYTAWNGIKIDNYKISSTVTDTHNTAYIYAGKSNGSSNTATTNGNTHLILKDWNSVSNRVKITGTNGVSVSSDNNGTITISGSTNSNTNKTLNIKWDGTSVTEFNWSSDETLNIVAGDNITITPQKGQIKISANTNNWVSMWSQTSSNSLRNAGTLKYWSANKQTTVNYITPKDSREIYLIQSRPNIYFWDGEQNSKLRFLNYWTNRYVTTAAEIRPNWATFWNVNSAIQTNLAWVSVAWYLIVWNSWQNYIYMYATWNAGASGGHYEIKANKELAIWIDSGAFMYFQSYSGNTATNHYRNMRIWINNNNPLATLDVKWSIRVSDYWNCFPPCTADAAWSIIYRKQTDSFYWCKKDWKRYQFQMWTNWINMNGINGCTQINSPGLWGI